MPPVPRWSPKSIPCPSQGEIRDAAAAPCFRPPADYQGLVKGAYQLAHASRVDGLVDRGAELRRARKPLGIPGDVLAGDARAHLGPVVVEHILVMVQNDVELRLERGSGTRRRPVSHSTTWRTNHGRP